MGYEIKFIIGLKSESIKTKFNNKIYNYVQPIAIYNYSVDYVLKGFIEDYGEASGCFTYVEDAADDAGVAVDKYGDELVAIDLKLLTEYFEAIDDEDYINQYRRLKPFKMLLQGFLDNKELFDSDFQKLIVLVYGY